MANQQLALTLQGGSGGFYEATRRRRRFRGINRCESQIEAQLAIALTHTLGFRPSGPLEHPWRVGAWDDHGVILLAQPFVGRYRPDFALVPFDWHCPDLLPVIIEVDGHDFHERTALQAERDRSRDRFMTSKGSTVSRFTGREVWRDRAACAGEVLSYAGRAAA